MWDTCDLPLGNDGRIYHLDLLPEEVADFIIIVGDPGRARLIARHYFEKDYFEREHRGLVSCTGTVVSGFPHSSGKRATILTSGMGTGSLEIVLGELLALKQFDLQSKTPLETFKPLKIIRVGTSGALRQDTPLGEIIISRFGLGLEVAAQFYQAPARSEVCLRLERYIREQLPSLHFSAYLAESDPTLYAKALRLAHAQGINARGGVTVSNSGFFAPQGRGFPPGQGQYSQLENQLAQIILEERELKVENMEMECSFLLWFAALQGWQALTIAPVIAHRPSGAFLADASLVIQQAAELALETLFYDF
jgi:uridine phosphorylase